MSGDGQETVELAKGVGAWAVKQFSLKHLFGIVTFCLALGAWLFQMDALIDTVDGIVAAEDEKATVLQVEAAIETGEDARAVLEERLRKWIARFEAFETHMDERETYFLTQIHELELEITRLHAGREGGG